MTIYILGAGGYIGSHLLAAFLNENNEDKNIVAVDRNLEYLSGLSVKKVKMDLAQKVPDFKDGDIVYHLATKKNYPSQFDREGAFRDIFVSTKNVVEAVRNKDVFLIFGRRLP